MGDMRQERKHTNKKTNKQKHTQKTPLNTQKHLNRNNCAESNLMFEEKVYITIQVYNFNKKNRTYLIFTQTETHIRNVLVVRHVYKQMLGAILECIIGGQVVSCRGHVIPDFGTLK